MAEINWIKLSTNLPDNKKIKRIRKLPDGDKVILFWVFLLVRAGESNRRGGLFLTDTLPYTEEDLAADFDFTIEIVKFALITLEKYSMITRYDDVIFIKNWEEYQAIEGMEKVREKNRIRQARHREKQKQLLESNVTDNVTSNADITQSNAVEIDIEIEKEKELKDKPRKHRKRVYEPDSIYFILAEELFKQICLNQEISKPNLNTWADDIRKMIEIDKRTESQVRKMIEWSQKHPFWHTNILSARKLREKYTTMAGQANEDVKKRKNGFKNLRYEELPDWVDNPQTEKEIDPQKQAEIEARFKEYQAKKLGGTVE